MRKTSEVEGGFPYDSTGVCYVVVMNDGEILNPRSNPPCRQDAAKIVQTGQGRLFIAWPGKWRTDLFEVDEPAEIDRLARGGI